MNEEKEYGIRHRAYQLWEAAGRPPGAHLQFWLEAEKEKTESQELSESLDASFPASDPPASTMRKPKAE